MNQQEIEIIKTSEIFQDEYLVISKEETITQYQADYLLLIHALQSIPEDKKTQYIFNNWRVNELISHVAHWSLETIQAIKKVQEGGIPWFFDDEKKIDAVNQEVTRTSQNMSLPALLEKLKANHTTLIEFLEILPEYEYHKSSGQLWKTQEVTPSLVCSYRHYLAHAKDILEWLEVSNL